MTFGIDISTAQRGLDLTQAAREGVEFVIVKASGRNAGTASYVADDYHNNIDRAFAAGLRKGHYFVTGRGSAKEQAEFFVKNLHRYDPDRDILALDNEFFGTGNANSEFWHQEKVMEFWERVWELLPKHPHNRCWQYAPAAATRGGGSWTRVADAGIRIWWAAYGGGPTGKTPDHEPSLQGSVSRWDIHQFTSSSRVAGYTLDGNYSRLSGDELFGGTTSGGNTKPAGMTRPSASKPTRTSTAADGVPGPVFWALFQVWARENGYTGPIDGKPGTNTWAAIQRGRKQWDGYTGPCDGVPGKNTYKALQRAAQHGGYDGPIDGVLGKNSYKGLATLLNKKFG